MFEHIIDTVPCILNFRLFSGHLGVVAGTLRESISRFAMVRSLFISRDSMLCVRAVLLYAMFSYKLHCSNLREFFNSRVCRMLLSELVKQEQKTTDHNQQKTRLDTSKLLCTKTALQQGGLLGGRRNIMLLDERTW